MSTSGGVRRALLLAVTPWAIGRWRAARVERDAAHVGTLAFSAGGALHWRAGLPTVCRRNQDATTTRMRVVVCVFGVLARSIHLAWPSVIRRILRPLRRDGHSVYIVGFNLDVGDASAVDGVRLNLSPSH